MINSKDFVAAYNRKQGHWGVWSQFYKIKNGKSFKSHIQLFFNCKNKESAEEATKYFNESKKALICKGSKNLRTNCGWCQKCLHGV